MTFSKNKVFYAFSRIAFFSLGIAIVTIASLELIFAPMMTLKYYGPSLLQHGIDNPALAFFYVTCVLVQVANFLGSLAFFFSMLFTKYNEKWGAFDTFGLLSVSASLSLVVHRELTGVDFYRATAEPDIYYQTAKIGVVRCSRKACFHNDVYVWHQVNQCCGWHSAHDLLALNNSPGRNHSDVLPHFCCYPDSTLVIIGDRVLLKGYSPLAEPCQLHSLNRFRATCSTEKSSFFELRTVSIISHPSSFVYSAIKLSTALSYAFMKKHYLPQAEGLYAYFMSA